MVVRFICPVLTMMTSRSGTKDCKTAKTLCCLMCVAWLGFQGERIVRRNRARSNSYRSLLCLTWPVISNAVQFWIYWCLQCKISKVSNSQADYSTDVVDQATSTRRASAIFKEGMIHQARVHRNRFAAATTLQSDFYFSFLVHAHSLLPTMSFLSIWCASCSFNISQSGKLLLY